MTAAPPALTLRTARRLAPAPAGWPGPRGGRRRHRPRVRTCNRHAKSQAAGHDGGGGTRTIAHGSSPRCQRNTLILAADDALPDRQHAAGRDRAREGIGFRARGEVLPGRRHDQFRLRASPRSTASIPCWRQWRNADMVLSLHGEVTDPAVDMFDRERVFVDTLLARIVRDFPGPQGRAGAHHDARGRGRSCARRTAQHRRHDHAAASPVVAQRAVRGRHPAALLLPADPQARDASRRRWSRQRPRATRATSSAPTPRRTRGTPRRTRAGAPAAIRRRWRSSSTPRRSRTANALDRLEAFASRFGAEFYGLPRNADTVTLERTEWDVPAELPVRRRTHRAAAGGRADALAAAHVGPRASIDAPDGVK